MKIRALIVPLVGALGLLAGCSKGSSNQDARADRLEAANAALTQKVASLGAEVRACNQHIDLVDKRNGDLEKTVSMLDQELRSRLLEMVQQEMGAGGRGFGGPRLARPAPLPKAYVGFDAENNSAETAKKFGLPVATGIVLTDVAEDGPADLAGLKKGDILQSLDEKPVKTREDLAQAFADIKPGQECQLGVLRGAEQLKVKVKVRAR